MTLNQKLFLSAVLELWRKGMNTYDIAITLDEPQEFIERRLHEALEIVRRRKGENEEGRQGQAKA